MSPNGVDYFPRQQGKKDNLADNGQVIYADL
jgi:hypothetical protein